MKKLLTLLIAMSVVTGNLSADTYGRDKCPCDDYTQDYTYVCPQPVVEYYEEPSASERGTRTGYSLVTLGAGAILIGAIAAAIICSDNDDSSSHAH